MLYGMSELTNRQPLYGKLNVYHSEERMKEFEQGCEKAVNELKKVLDKTDFSQIKSLNPQISREQNEYEKYEQQRREEWLSRTIDEKGRKIVDKVYVAEDEYYGGAIRVVSNVDSNGRQLYTPGSASNAAKLGFATHPFFFYDNETDDFLLRAAKKYSNLEENEVFRSRQINDTNFVRDTLDFFTGGNYTENDIEIMKNGITEVVVELGQQLRRGEEFDLNKVKSTLIIAGNKVSMKELSQLMKVGKECIPVLESNNIGSLVANSYAKKGIVQSFAQAYGKQYGNIGEMFAKGIDRLYQKSVQQLEKQKKNIYETLYDNSYQIALKPMFVDSISTGCKIANLFTNIDMSNKETLGSNLKNALDQTKQFIQQHNNRFGIPTSSIELTNETRNIVQYMEFLLKKL